MDLKELSVSRLQQINSNDRRVLHGRVMFRALEALLVAVADKKKDSKKKEQPDSGQISLMACKILSQALLPTHKLPRQTIYAPVRTEMYGVGEKKGQGLYIALKNKSFQFSYQLSSRYGSSQFSRRASGQVGIVSIQLLNSHQRDNISDFLHDLSLEKTSDLISTSLWRTKEVALSNPFKTIDYYSQSNTWSYWGDWYQGLLEGKLIDWDIQNAIIAIPEPDWDKGPAHIADKIEEIKARFLADKAPLAEKVELNPETGKFFVTPVPARKPDLLNTTLEKASDALDDALNGRNGLSADDRVTRVLRRCFDKYTHNPERIEMDFVDAHAGLTRQMASGELADSEEILSLAEVLKNGALDIRANHPDIAANRETRAARALQELTPEQKQQFEDAQPILEALTEGEAHQDMGADIPALINDMIGPVPDYAPPVGPAVRVVHRAAKMSLMMRMKDFDAKLVEKCGYKSIEIFSALGTVIGIGLAIFGLF